MGSRSGVRCPGKRLGVGGLLNVDGVLEIQGGGTMCERKIWEGTGVEQKYHY